MPDAIAGARLRTGALLIGLGVCLRVACTVLVRLSPKGVILDLVGVLAQGISDAAVMFLCYCAAAYCLRKAREPGGIAYFTLLALSIFSRAIGSLLYYAVLHFAPIYPLRFVPGIAQFVIAMAIFARLFTWRLREVLLFAAFDLAAMLVVGGIFEAVAHLMQRP